MVDETLGGLVYRVLCSTALDSVFIRRLRTVEHLMSLGKGTFWIDAGC